MNSLKITSVSILASIVLLAAPAGFTSAATIFSDSFGTGSTVTPVPGWTDGGISGDDSEARASGSGNDTASPDGDRFAVAFGDSGWICQTVNTSGYDSVELSYYWRGDSDAEGSDDGIVEIKSASGNSCGDGSGWTPLQSHDLSADGSWTTQSAFTNAGMDDTSFLLRFRVDSSQSDEHLRVDGVLVAGTAILLDQTITFGALSDKTYGDADFGVSATGGGSGNPVTFSSQTPSVCTVSGSTVHIVSVGGCTVRASQAGNGTYNAAPDVDRSFTVDPKALTITPNDDTKTYGDTKTFAGTEFTTSALVSGDSVSSVTLASTGAVSTAPVSGSPYTITSSAAVGTGISNYDITYGTGSLTVTAKSLTVTATGINKVYDGNTDGTVTLTSTDVVSPDVVTFSYIPPAVFASPDSAIGIAVAVSGISIGGADAGNYSLLSTTADTIANITPDVGTIVVDDVSVAYDGNPHSVDKTGDTTPTGLAYVITYNGSVTAPTNAGSYTVLAALTDTNYAGTDTATLTITKIDQTITFDPLADKTFTDADFTVSATSDSGLTPTFAVSGNCILIGTDTVHLTGAGSCTVTASQSGNVNYNAATPVPQTFSIAAGSFSSSTVTVSPLTIQEATSTAIASTNGSGKWFFYNDETDVLDNTLGSFVFGTTTPPLTVGSAKISVTGTERRNLATYRFSGVELADITELKFSTFNPSAGNGGSATRSAYLNFNVDFDGSDTWQRRIAFVPNQNGTVTQDTWQEWDAINSGDAEYSYSGSVWPGTATPGTTLKTWNQILAEYPGVRIRVTDAWLGLRVGEPYADGYTEYMDKFVFATGSTETVFDFEPDTGAPVITLSGDGTMNLTTGSTFSDPGATAVDDVDGSVPVTVGGDTVDTGTVGTYHITYDAVDSSGNNATQVIRTVNVSAPASSGGGGGGGGGNGPIVGSGGIGFFGSVLGASTSNVGGGSVLGASTTAESTSSSTTTCSAIITKIPMKVGIQNDSTEVKALQTFLNGEMSSGIPVSGFFGPLTEASVKAFQTKYATDILAPWGLTAPTGIVFKTTAWKVNMLNCPSLGLPAPTVTQ